jgi:hypothetical protein
MDCDVSLLYIIDHVLLQADRYQVMFF